MFITLDYITNVHYSVFYGHRVWLIAH